MGGNARSYDEAVEKELRAEAAQTKKVQGGIACGPQPRPDAEVESDNLLQEESVKERDTSADGKVQQKHAGATGSRHEANASEIPKRHR